MKPSEVSIYALLLVVALGMSYSAWKAEDAPAASESVVVFDPGKGGASSVDWTGERSAAHLEFTGQVDEAEVWITAGRRHRIAAPAPPPMSDDKTSSDTADSEKDAVAEETPVEVPEPVYGEPELTSFPGNTTASGLAKQFAPLTAMRQFDNLTVEQLADMGLDEASSRLVVEGGGRSIELEIGDKAYGSSDVYAREPGKATAYLLSRKTVGNLKSASTSLRDKNLFGFEATDASVVSILSPGSKDPITARHQGRHDKDNAFWSNAESEELHSGLDGLLKKVFEAKASRYLKADDLPAADTLEPLVALSFKGESSSLGEIAFARRVNTEKSTDDDVVHVWYARSTRSRDQWVEVSKSVGSDIVDALASLN